MRGLKIGIKVPVEKQSWYWAVKGSIISVVQKVTISRAHVSIIWPLSVISLIPVMLEVRPITPVYINYSLYTYISVLYFKLYVGISRLSETVGKNC